MNALRSFGRFWYDFLVGDDWRLAAGVLVLVPIVFVGTHHGANVWWVLPLGVALLLAVSVGIAARRARQRAG
jgi:hypothetical protein